MLCYKHAMSDKCWQTQLLLSCLLCAQCLDIFPFLDGRADAETDKSASTRGDGRRGRASKKRKEEDAPSEQPANGRKRRRAAKKDASSPAPGRPQVMWSPDVSTLFAH